MEIIMFVELLTFRLRMLFLCSRRFNSISRIHDSSLAGLKEVELLMLHSNDLHHLPDAVFRDMKSLQVNTISSLWNYTSLGQPMLKLSCTVLCQTRPSMLDYKAYVC